MRNISKSSFRYLLFFGFLLVGSFLLSLLNVRLDLTKEKRYTLTSAATKIIENVQSPVSVDIYLDGDFPADFRQLQNETRFMLQQFGRLNPKISYRFIDPIAEKIPRDTLFAKGMQPSVLPDIQDGKISQIEMYPYAVMRSGKRSVTMPLLVDRQGMQTGEQLNRSIENLEYQLVSGLKNISDRKKKMLGIIINHDELSVREFDGFMRMASENYQPFPVIPADGKEITSADVPNLNRAAAIVVAKPRKAFTDSEKLILDQYIMRGGRSLWMMDAVNVDMDTLARDKKMMPYPVDLNLTDFFFNYGVRINAALVKDFQKRALLRLVTGEVAGNPQFTSLPWPYFPLGIAETSNPITKNINPVKFEFPTSIDTLGRPGIKTQVLFESGERTNLKQVPNFVSLSEISNADSLGQAERPSTPKIFAVSLEGKFRSAYAARSERTAINNFMGQSPDNKMVVIADGDVAKNKILRGQALPLGYDIMTDQMYGNEQFLRNVLDYLLEDSNLMSLRNRNIEARLLDQDKIGEQAGLWRWLNLLLPLVTIGICAAGYYFYRKRKFSTL